MENTITKINDLLEEVKKETKNEVVKEIIDLLIKRKKQCYYFIKCWEKDLEKVENQAHKKNLKWLIDRYTNEMCDYNEAIDRIKTYIEAKGIIKMYMEGK